MLLVSLLYPVAVEGTDNIRSDGFACTRIASNVPDAIQRINTPKCINALSPGLSAGQNRGQPILRPMHQSFVTHRNTDCVLYDDLFRGQE